MSGQLATEQNRKNRSSILKNISENESEIISEKPPPRSTELKFSLDSTIKPAHAAKIVPPKNFSLNAAQDSSLEGRSVHLASKTDPFSRQQPADERLQKRLHEDPADNSNSLEQDLHNLPSSKFTIPVRIGTNKSIDDQAKSLKHIPAGPLLPGQKLAATPLPFFSGERPPEPSQVVAQLLAEKEGLLGALGRQRRELEELQAYLREKTAKSAKQSVVDHVSELEKELKLLDDNNEAKRMKIQKLRRKIRDRLAAKKATLEQVDDTKSQILAARKHNQELAEVIGEKRSALVSTSLAMNDLMRRTVGSEGDIRLLKVVGAPGGEQTAEPHQRVTFFPGEVRLHADYLPRDWNLAKTDPDAIVRMKFLTLRQQGLCYEDACMKVAVKRKPDGAGGLCFVVRLINCGPAAKQFQASFLNFGQNVLLGKNGSAAELPPGGHFELEFRVLDPPLNELPRLQVKTADPSARDFLLTNVSLPIALHWHFPSVKLTPPQFDSFWLKGFGHFLQSELREVDRSIIASGADLLALLPAAAEYAGEPRRDATGYSRVTSSDMVSCYVLGLTISSRLAAMKFSLTASGLLFIEMMAASRAEEAVCIHIMNLYLYALCMFRYSVPQHT